MTDTPQSTPESTPQSIDDMLVEQERLEMIELEKRSSGFWDIPVLLVFGFLFVTVFLQFFTRYVLNDSLSWTEEAARYLLILLTFVGASKCQILDSHIRLEFIDHYLPNHVAKLKLLSLVLTTGYFAFLAYVLTILAKQTKFQNMVSLPFPKYYLYILVFIALVALVWVQLAEIRRSIKGFSK